MDAGSRATGASRILHPAKRLKYRAGRAAERYAIKIMGNQMRLCNEDHVKDLLLDKYITACEKLNEDFGCPHD